MAIDHTDSSNFAVTVTPYHNGPLLIRGDFRLVDQQGRDIPPTSHPVALCRCGRSRLRPFCDGSHRLAGFSAPSQPDPNE
jgi:CDGSH-type Zn-finger protein